MKGRDKRKRAKRKREAELVRKGIVIAPMPGSTVTGRAKTLPALQSIPVPKVPPLYLAIWEAGYKKRGPHAFSFKDIKVKLA